MDELPALVVALLLLAANAFFVGAEFALVAARRSVVEPEASGGKRAARTTLAAMDDVSLMMAAAQLGITVASLALGAIAEPAVAHLIEAPFAGAGLPDDLLHPVAFVIALAVVVFLHVVLGEMVPKNLALAGPERLAFALVPALVLLVRIVRPVIAVLNAVANLHLRVVGVTPKDEVTSSFTRDEVAGLVNESHREGLLDDDEHRLLSGALEFGERKVSTVLVPVNTMVTVSGDATVRDIEHLAARSGFSRFPVQNATGELTGYLHLKDVLAQDGTARDEPVAAKRIRQLVRVGHNERLRPVLVRMQESGAHLGVVTDDEGTLLGVVTLADVLDELFRELEDVQA